MVTNPAEGPDARAPSGRWAVAGLLLLCAALLWLRTRNLDYLLPHQPEPDHYAVAQVEHLRARAAGSREAPPFTFYFYPMLLARLQLALPEPPPPARPAPGEDALTAHLRAAGAPIERSRTIVALLSVLAVPGTFLVARAFVGPWVALLAAAFSGASFLHLVFSGQARPHGMACAWSALAIAAALALRRRPTPATYALAGLAAMLAVCSLQNGSAVLLALVAAHLLRDRQRERGGWPKLLAPVAIVSAGVLYLYPFLVERAPEGTTQSYTALRIEDGILKYGGHEIPLELFRGQGFGRMARFLAWNEPWLLGAGGVGLLVVLGSWVRRRGALPAGRMRDAAVVLAHALPYAFMLGLYKKTFDRYLLPLLPVLSLVSAVGVAALIELLARPLARWRLARPLCAAVAAALALAWPARVDWRLMRLRGLPDTQEVTAAWLREHVAPRELVVTGPGVVLPLFYERSLLSGPTPERRDDLWLDYQRVWGETWDAAGALRVHDPFHVTPREEQDALLARLGDPEGALAWLDQLGADWFVLEVSERPRHTLGGPSPKGGFANLRKALVARGKRVLRVRPFRELEVDIYRDYQDQEQALERLAHRERFGPEMEVWKLR